MPQDAERVRFMPVPEVLLEKNSIVLIKTFLALQNWSGRNTSSLLPILSDETGHTKPAISRALKDLERLGIAWRIEKQTDASKSFGGWYDQWHLHDNYNVKKVRKRRRG